MSESTPVNPAESGLEVQSHFVRGRNAMVVKADFGELYVDYYLHLGQNKIKPSEAHDALFKRALAAFTLHCASRPWNEMIAWTMNFQDPLVNLFLTGDNESGSVTGRIFSENVKQLDQNVFYSDVVRPSEPKHRSAVNFAGSDPLGAVETLYLQSEQRPARFFQTGEEEFVLVNEQPDCDRTWFESLGVDAVRDLEKNETVSLLEKRIYRWHCGCNQRRMFQVLAPAMTHDPDELFGGQESIDIHCPRCAAHHTITREAMEAYMKTLA